MDIELENNSAPELERFLQERHISNVIFDVDNTLFNTYQYYSEAIMLASLEVAEWLTTSKPSERIAIEMEKKVFQIYRRGNSQPVLVGKQYIEALTEYLDQEPSLEMLEAIQNVFSDFYMETPTLKEHSLKVLRTLLECNVGITLHSHAQEEWTRMKAEVLSDGLDTQIPYLATPIDVSKDERSWIMAASLSQNCIANTLVVGDSLQSDIFPAISAGCKHLVWIDEQDKGLPSDINLPEDVELIIVRDISELMLLGRE